MTEQMKEFIESKLESERLSLVTIRGGAAVEMFDRQLDRVMQNIADINTDKKPRKITLEVAIAPADDARSMVAFAINVPPRQIVRPGARTGLCRCAGGPQWQRGLRKG